MDIEQPEIKLSAAGRFRKHFYTGLLVLAPVWLTAYVILLVVRLLGGYLSPFVRAAAIPLLGHGMWERPVNIVSDIVAFILTVLFIALIGLAVRKVFGKRLVEGFDQLLGRIPVIREIYNGVRKFLDVVFGDKTKLRKVVAVRFPTESTWSIGFVTSELRLALPPETESNRVAVYVPKTPNPTNGYLLLCRPEDIVPLALSVDEALKLIVSGGTLVPDRFVKTVV